MKHITYNLQCGKPIAHLYKHTKPHMLYITIYGQYTQRNLLLCGLQYPSSSVMCNFTS